MPDLESAVAHTFMQILAVSRYLKLGVTKADSERRKSTGRQNKLG